MTYKLSMTDMERVRYFSLEPFIYDCTRISTGVVSSALNDSSSNWGRGIAIVLSPFAIAGLPACLIADTVLLPYDTYKYYKIAPHIQFWYKADNAGINIVNGNITNIDDFKAHYNPISAKVISTNLNLLPLYKNEDLASLLFILAERNPEIKQSKNIINYFGKSELLNKKHMQRICDRTLKGDKADNNLMFDLARNRTTPDKCLREYSKLYVIHISTATTPLTLKYVVSSNTSSSKSLLKSLAISGMEDRDIPLLQRIILNKSSSNETVKRVTDWALEVLKNPAPEVDTPRVNGLFAALSSRIHDSNSLALIYPYLHDESSLIVAANNSAISKAMLIEMIQDHADKNKLLRAIAKGSRVDIDIFYKLFAYATEQNEYSVLEDIIYNDNLVDKSIIQKLASIEKIEVSVNPYAYKVLLKITEPLTINIIDFGIVEFQESNEHFPEEFKNIKGFKTPGTWVVTKHTDIIPKTMGVKFGIFYEASKKHSYGPFELQYDLIYPEGGIKNIDSGEIMDAATTDEGWVNSGEGNIFYEYIDKPWMLKSGEWVFQLKHKGQVIAEKTFYVKDQ